MLERYRAVPLAGLIDLSEECADYGGLRAYGQALDGTKYSTWIAESLVTRRIHVGIVQRRSRLGRYRAHGSECFVIPYRSFVATRRALEEKTTKRNSVPRS